MAGNPVVTYDPVALTVSLSNPDATGATAWLTPGQFYEVDLGIPSGATLGGGLRAIDGQTLDPSSTLAVGFSVTAAQNPATCTQSSDCVSAAAPFCDATSNRCRAPKVSFCDDIQPIFLNKCSAGQCHGAPVAGTPRLPAEGLILETSLGVKNTAVGRVSNESNTGALAGRELPPGRQFGVNMPIIDEGTGGGGDPGNSWLLYKMMLTIPATTGDSTRACGPGPTCLGAASPPADSGVADAGATEGGAASCALSVALVPPAAWQAGPELLVLRNYVLGREMPFPTYPGGQPMGVPDDNPPLTLVQLERVRLWIAQGAPVQECTCQ